jgi:Tol biopolymer transport system component/DNA-binding winged helix-turn-helix (wHTH) protein
VAESATTPTVLSFGVFEVNLRAGELRKNGSRLKLAGQPFQVLAILLERPGEVITREELQKRLWPDTFVDVDHNLNTAINKIRDVLGDSSENPRFVETLSRRGYRFIARVNNGTTNGAMQNTEANTASKASPKRRVLATAILLSAIVLLGAASYFYKGFDKGRNTPASPRQRSLTRITFDDGLQTEATWSPDGRFIAYSSDRGGKFDVWVQQVSGGDPVQITKGPGHHWQPDWSPDGKHIAYRSEEGDGGLYVVPALGGAGLERKIASFGFHPRWSPDNSQILFDSQFTPLYSQYRFYAVQLDGSPPREVLTEFLAQHRITPSSVVWHPDGKRVSIWAWNEEEVDSALSSNERRKNLWTIPLAGGAATKSEIAPAVQAEIERIAADGGAEFSVGSSDYSWAPSGNAIYFDQVFRGARNIWKMTVDPATLRITAIERLTAGPGPDRGAVVSPDGRRVAFAAQSEHIRSLLFPFDSITGQISGSGQALTSPGMTAFEEDLSRDGKKIAFCAVRAGRWELWEKSLVDGREAPVITDHDRRIYPKWSPDGRRLVYTRQKSHPGDNQTKSQVDESQMMLWSVDTRTETPLSSLTDLVPLVYDWSSDGKELLLSQYNRKTDREEIWRLSMVAALRAEIGAQKIISNPALDIYQAHFSPDGHWIAFEATRALPGAVESTLYVTSAAGGPWIRITDGKQWDDKPRWSPDGKTIYFVSRRGGFFNVWGTRFDPVQGKPVGQAFHVSAFERPSSMVPQQIQPVALSITKDHLLLTMSEVSGGIWVVDNLEQ